MSVDSLSMLRAEIYFKIHKDKALTMCGLHMGAPINSVQDRPPSFHFCLSGIASMVDSQAN